MLLSIKVSIHIHSPLCISMYYPALDSESAVLRRPAAPPSLDLPLSPSHTDSVISVSVTTDSHSPVLLFLEENVWSETPSWAGSSVTGWARVLAPLNNNMSDEQNVPHYSFQFDS